MKATERWFQKFLTRVSCGQIISQKYLAQVTIKITILIVCMKLFKTLVPVALSLLLIGAGCTTSTSFGLDTDADLLVVNTGSDGELVVVGDEVVDSFGLLLEDISGFDVGDDGLYHVNASVTVRADSASGDVVKVYDSILGEEGATAESAVLYVQSNRIFMDDLGGPGTYLRL